MRRTALPPFRDRDLIEMLSNDPELLAIADGLVASRDEKRSERKGSGVRRNVATAAGGFGVAIAAVVLLLISPWQGRTSLVDHALAAVGQQPVLHVVLEQRSDGVPLIDLGSGRTVPQSLVTEIWFDDTRHMERTVTTIDGKWLGMTLETPQSRPSDEGFVYTCEWIAEHPEEAAAARVSCTEGGSKMRTVGGQGPAVDPALQNFVDRYQSALASGHARRVGEGQLGGHDVIWLAVRLSGSQTGERVAIDATTFKPIVVEGGAQRFRVLTIETVPFAPRLFAKRRIAVEPSSGLVLSESRLDPRAAADVLGTNALWLGDAWRGLQLINTQRQEVETRYPRTSRQSPTQNDGVEFRYALQGTSTAPRSRSAIIIREANSCQFAYGWSCGANDPGPGQISLRGVRSLARIGDLYVAIWDFRDLRKPRALEIAHSLMPVSKPFAEGP